MTQELRRLADDLDAEFAQGRISNHNGRKAAAEIRLLLDRLEKAEKDAARLDWLDGCAHVATWVDGEPTKLVIDAASGDGFKGDTWRDAIDSAMEASK